MHRRSLTAISLGLFVGSGCSGGTGSAPIGPRAIPQSPPTSGSSAKTFGSAKLEIAIPSHGAAQTSARRRPLHVSASARREPIYESPASA